MIGAGFSGVAVAAHLAQRGNASPHIVLIERGERFGLGLAYSTKEDAHLLNVRAGNMSGMAAAPGDFAVWLGQEGAREAFAQRRHYGAYVEHMLRRAELGARIERMRGEAIACRAQEGRWLVTLADGRIIEADTVLLAIGHRSPAPPPALADLPLVDAWDAAARERLPPRDVLLLGTGLTMVDVALSLARRSDHGAIYALSRRGLIPRGHLDAPPQAPAEPLELPVELSEAVRVFRREVEAMAARGEPWQSAIARLRADTPRLWQRLPTQAQRRFLRHLRPWWDVHRHLAPPSVAGKLTALQASGRLRVLAGEIVAAAPGPHCVLVHYRPRGTHARRELDVAAVVNCTGSDPDLSRAAEPLVSQLLNDRVARPHPSGLGLDVDSDCRVLGADGTAQHGLFAIGPPTQGAFWECTAVPEIRARAAALAALL